MKNKMKNSLLLFILGVILPILIVILYNKTHHNDFRFILQYINGLVTFFSSIILFVMNAKGFLQSRGSDKATRALFIVLSLLFFVYISIALFFQFTFRNVGF